jgi:spermidine/putrescine transport system substrate-binding protein
MSKSLAQSISVNRRTLMRTAAASAVGASALSTAIAQASTGSPGFFVNLNQDAGELAIYAWYQAWLDEVVPMFEEETGIKVTNLGAYSTNAEWWARLNAGESFDFFIPTTDWMQRAMRADLLHEIDIERVPNIANLFADFQDNETYKQDGTPFAVPYSRLMFCLGYNTNEFPEPPTSWDVTWDEQYAGKITMEGSAQARVGTTALFLGDDPLNPTQWDEISDRLLEQKELVLKYWTDYQNSMEMFVSEDVLVGEISDGRARMGMAAGGAMNWTVPEEGCLAYVDTFAIPTTSENPENAHAFIDFLLRADITAIQMEMMNYDTMNEAALAELDPAFAEQLAGSQGTNIVITEDIDPQVRAHMDELWTEIELS